MVEDLSRFIGDPTDQPAPSTTITDELLTKLDELIRSHPALAAMRDKIDVLEQRVEDGFEALGTPAEIHVRPQDPNELGELPADEGTRVTT